MTTLEGLGRLQLETSAPASEAQEGAGIVLQVVQIKEIKSRFSLRLSDGKHFLQVMAASHLSPLFLGPEPTIRLFDIVRIKEHTVNEVQAIKLTLVLDLEKIESREAIEGSPEHVEEQMESIKNFKTHVPDEAFLVEKEEDAKVEEEEKQEEKETSNAVDDDQVHPDGSIDFSALSLVQATWVTTEKEIEKRVALISAEMVKQGFINEFVASKMLNYNLKFKNLSASEVFQDAPSFRWKNRRYQRAVYSSSRRAPRAETTPSSSSSTTSSSSTSSSRSAPKLTEPKKEEKPLTTEEFCQQFGLTEEEMNKVTLHHLKLKVTETKSTGQTMITVLGNTFAYKEDLKSIGCRWNRYQQGWSLPWGCQQKLIALLSSLEVRPVLLPHSTSSPTPSDPTPSSSSDASVDPEPVKEEPGKVEAQVDPEPAKEEPAKVEPELEKAEVQADPEPAKEEPQVDQEPVREESQADQEPVKEEPETKE